MTTNLKIQIDDKADIELTPIPGSNNSTLTIQLDAGPLKAWNNGTAVGVNGDFDLIGIGFPIDNNHLHNVESTEINRIQITGPTEILTTFHNLILLKDDVKNIGGPHKQNIFDFELTSINHNLGQQTDHWDITPPTGAGANDRILKLSAVDFGGVLDESKISIDDTVYHGRPDNKIEVVEDRRGDKWALLRLEKLLKSLPAKYGVKYSADPDLNELDLARGPDVSFIDPSSDLGKPKKTLVSGLWNYVVGVIAGFARIDPKPGNIKHILYELRQGHDSIYGEEIGRWVEYLEDVKFSLFVLGLTKKSQPLIVSDATLGGGYKDVDFPEIRKEPGFYKGFPLVDPNLQALPDPADGNKFKVSKIDPDKPVRYTKENIDNFRNFANGRTDHEGKVVDMFIKEKTIQDKDGNDVQVYANRLPEDCFGFQPGDVVKKTTAGFDEYLYVNGKWLFRHNLTKIDLDILSAQNCEEAMDLAFFGKDYDLPQSDNEVRKGNPNPKFQLKTPNANLQFNELRGLSRLFHLEQYWETLKAGSHVWDGYYEVKWRIPGDTTGAGVRNAPNYDDPATKQKIDEGYNLAKEFITDYENWLGTSLSSLNKAELETAKTKLEKWKTTRFYTSGGVWCSVIDNFLTEVNGALSMLDDDPDNDVPNWYTELAGLKNRGSELAKKIYQNCQPDQDEFTEAVFEELKKLIKLLEEAHGTKTTNTKTELKQFISDSNNNFNKNKALEIAKKVKNQTSDSKNCVETALEKLAGPSDNKLEQARQQLKALLAGLKIGDKDAYEVIITDIKNSETDINKVIQIWQKCQETDEATDDDQGELLDALNNLKNDIGNGKAWEAVNKYKKDDQSQGYANDLLKKLNDWAKQRKKDYFDIKNAKSKSEFQIAKEEFMKKHEYQNNKQDYDEIYFPLAEKAAEIREKGTKLSSEEGELAESMVVVVSDYTDWKSQLIELEDKLSKLKKYVEGGERYHVVKNYSTVQKQALEKLVNKMESKLKEWNSKKSESEKNNSSQENPPWYKTPIEIFGIILMLVIVISGIVYYFVKQKTSRKE